MSFFSSPKIVTNGLVCCLDAATPKSLISGATTWNNLAASPTGVLISGAAYVGNNLGAVNFTGGGTRAFIGPPGSYVFGTGNFALETWIQPTTLGGDRTFIDFDQNGIGGNAYPLLYIKAGTTVVTYYTQGGARINGVTPLAINNWYHVVFSRTGLWSNLYVNGQYNGSEAGGDNRNYSTGNFVLLGGEPATISSQFLGLMPIFRIYSGVGLSQAQVTQNFNAQRGRFSI